MTWDDLASVLTTWLPPALGTAVLGGLVALAVQRTGKRLDRRAKREGDLRSGRQRQRIQAAHLRGLRRRRVTTPGKWSVEYDHDLPGYVNLVFHGGASAHRVRIDVIARDGGYATNRTIEISTVPRGLEVTIPLGVPARARLSTIAVEWDDGNGIDQFDRLPLARHLTT